MGCGNVCLTRGHHSNTQLQNRYDALLKLVLIGSSGVGKTSLLRRYVDDTFITSFVTTIGIDFMIKTINIEGYTIKLQLWDTAGGQERFQTIARAYYRGAHAFILVYDEYNTDSLNSWRDKLREYGPCENVPVLILENKVDFSKSNSLNLFFNGYRRKTENEYRVNIPYEMLKICEMYYNVGISEGETMAQKNNWGFYQVSAKTGLNVMDAFEYITKITLAYCREHHVFNRHISVS